VLALLSLVNAAEFHPGIGPETVPLRFETTDKVLAQGDATAIAAYPGVVHVSERPGGLLVVTTEGDPVSLSNELWALDEVTWAHPDFVLPIVPHYEPDDPYLVDQWHLVNVGQRGMSEGADIRADLAWEFSTGEGQIIAVFDSGVRDDHPDLDVINGYDFVGGDEDSNPDPSHGSAAHGTAVAGVAAARGDNGVGVTGVAYDAQIYGVRMIGGSATLEDIYDGFVEAVDAGAGVLNNSWGFGDCAVFETYEVLRQMNKYAEDNGRGGLGSVVVVSAGNDNCDTSGDGWKQQRLTVTVAASDGHDVRESYSNFGDVLDITGPSGALLTTDLVEGGYGSWAEDAEYYGWFSGTSGSAPVVSGVFALMFAANDRLTAADAREVICDTAVRIDTDSGTYDETGFSPYYGCGRVDAGAAVLAVANSAPRAPALTGPDQPYVDRVRLTWDPAEDLDADWLNYEVAWTLNEVETVWTTTEHFVDLTGHLEVGDVVTWSVTPIDLWGPGETSAEAGFSVSARPTPEVEPDPEPEDPGACATAPLGGLWLVMLLYSLRTSSRFRSIAST